MHYEITDWLDYVHGLAGDEIRGRMEAHAAECQGCAETIRWLQRLVEAAVAEAEYYVPEHAVQLARAMYALQRPETVKVLPRASASSLEEQATGTATSTASREEGSLWRRGMAPRPHKERVPASLGLARLVFDSFREPVMAGVRSQQRIARQALYEAGDYSIDLRMEKDRGTRTVVLVGQIANRVKPEERLAEIPIVLMSGREVVGRAQSNEFGEFQMEYAPRQPLSLFVPMDGSGQEIEVRLKDLAGDTQARESKPANK